MQSAMYYCYSYKTVPRFTLWQKWKIRSIVKPPAQPRTSPCLIKSSITLSGIGLKCWTAVSIQNALKGVHVVLRGLLPGYVKRTHTCPFNNLVSLSINNTDAYNSNCWSLCIAPQENPAFFFIWTTISSDTAQTPCAGASYQQVSL